MKLLRNSMTRLAALLLTGIWALVPASAPACAACFGQSDTKLAEGLNIGIFALLGCIVLVMVWIGGFFVYLSRRAAAAAQSDDPDQAIVDSSTTPQS